jgi:putative NADH-flavin reductase
MRVALFGATGKTGSAILKEILHNAGEVESVRILVRDESKVSHIIDHKSVTIIKG